GLPANSELETHAPHLWWAADGLVPAAPRPQAQFPGGPAEEPVLLLWLRPWRRPHPLRRAVPRCELRGGAGAAPAFRPSWVFAIRCGAFLHRHPEAAAYLQQRGIHQPEVIEEFAIGYAPGRCLRHWLITLGYSLGELQQAGLVNAAGLDSFSHRIVFP